MPKPPVHCECKIDFTGPTGNFFSVVRGRSGRRPAERYSLTNDNVVSSDDTPDRRNFKKLVPRSLVQQQISVRPVRRKSRKPMPRHRSVCCKLNRMQ